ncbi:MAG: hypothetical protein D3923_03510 [Candidatus Electrothrix sp. AR3]|nr:hypothetical protein [Candidatus Electrothrix sp. AR3]
MKTSSSENEIHPFSEEIPEQFIVTEQELDPEVYEQFLASYKDPPSDYSTLIKKSRLLFDESLPVLEKQFLLAQLAQCGTPEAYRLIEQYNAHPDPALEQWSRIAYYECRMRLEQDLLDEPVGLISTGLGGAGERLRYIYVLGLCNSCPAKIKQHIKESLEAICQQHDAVLEEVDVYPAYLFVQVLVSMKVAVGEVIEESIVSLNQQDTLFSEDYLVTNVSKPTDEEIQAFLKPLRLEG